MFRFLFSSGMESLFPTLFVLLRVAGFVVYDNSKNQVILNVDVDSLHFPQSDGNVTMNQPCMLRVSSFRWVSIDFLRGNFHGD